MKIDACFYLPDGALGPDPWDEDYGISLPLDHVICRDVDGRPVTIREFIWPWGAYHAHKKTTNLHFFYWNQVGNRPISPLEITPEREHRLRELQFLMTRPIYFGNDNAVASLNDKLNSLKYLARFAEERSCKVLDVLTQTELLDTCGESVPNHQVARWMSWLTFLSRLDPEKQLGFALATPRRWKDLDRRAKEHRDSSRQHAPLPTRIFGATISNLSDELKDIEAHKKPLLAALREIIHEYLEAKAYQTTNVVSIGRAMIEKHGLAEYFAKRGITLDLPGFSHAIGEIYQACKWQIHTFSGMRKAEGTNLPYRCMVTEKGRHGRTHSLIVGTTTKFNKGRRLRTKWVTTDDDGFRAIRLAQEFASVIYEVIGMTPSRADDKKDHYPLFPSPGCLPWSKRGNKSREQIAPYQHEGKVSLLARLCPIIEEADIQELEEIDPFRSWREEPKFAIGKRWPLNKHQLRRSLALYANASGLVRISSLRRQLQQITNEMAYYYGRGSTFCKNFIGEDPKGFKEHIAIEWQDGDEESQSIAMIRDIITYPGPMHGGAGIFYMRAQQRNEVMSLEEVDKQVKAGLMAKKEGPLGHCTKPGVCEKRKGLMLIDTSCATDGCKYLVGKHHKIIQVIKYKRAAMTHITPGSITEAMEKEDLAALERVELAWRPQHSPVATSTGTGHG